MGITQPLIGFSQLYRQQWLEAMLRKKPLGSYMHSVGWSSLNLGGEEKAGIYSYENLVIISTTKL